MSEIGVACIVTISCFNINLNGRQFSNANGKRYFKRRRIKATKEKKAEREKEKTTGLRIQENSFFSRLILLEYYWSFFYFCSQRDFRFFFFQEDPDPKLHFTTKIAFYCPARGFGYTPDSKYELKNLPNGTHSISFILASKKNSIAWKNKENGQIRFL